MRRFIRKIRRKIKGGSGVRMDVSIIDIQPNVNFEVYWKVLAHGRGPAIILNAFDREIIKFDCFGKWKGHYHISPCYGLRIYLLEETALEQIQRAKKELLINGQRYLGIQSDRRIKNLVFDEERLAAALNRAEEQMMFLLENIQELEGIK